MARQYFLFSNLRSILGKNCSLSFSDATILASSARGVTVVNVSGMFGETTAGIFTFPNMTECQLVLVL